MAVVWSGVDDVIYCVKFLQKVEWSERDYFCSTLLGVVGLLDGMAAYRIANGSGEGN